jgi:prephenate dehydratase
MKIAIQGVVGAFHDEAARRFFGEDISLLECDMFRLLCGKVDSGEADYGIMAIENTIAGSLLHYFIDMYIYVTQKRDT